MALLKPSDDSLDNQLTSDTTKIKIKFFQKYTIMFFSKKNMHKTPTRSHKTFESNTNKV